MPLCVNAALLGHALGSPSASPLNHNFAHPMGSTIQSKVTVMALETTGDEGACKMQRVLRGSSPEQLQ